MVAISSLSTRRLRRLLSLFLLPALLLSLFAPTSPQAAAQEPESQQAATLPARYKLTELPLGFRAYSLNDSGVVVGERSLQFGQGIAALWQNDTLTEMAPAPSALFDINARGDIVGSHSGAGFRISGGALIYLGAPRDELDRIPFQIAVRTINASGLAGGDGSYGTTRPLLFDGPAGSLLPGLSRFGGQVIDLNDRGLVVGSATTDDGRGVAVLWAGGAPIPLGSLGGSRSQAIAINNRDQVIGEAYANDNTFVPLPFLWENNQMTALPVPSRGSANVSDINDAGIIVGQGYDPATGIGAFAWVNRQLINLNAHLPAGSGVTLRQALKITPEGRILAGGERAGMWYYYILTPESGPELTDLTLQRQDRESAAWVDLPDPANIADGAPLRASATIRHTGTQTATVRLAFRDKLTGRGFPGCERVIEVPPTPADQPLRERCEIDTSELAWADGDPNTIGTRFAVEVELAPAGQPSQKRDKPLTVRPRPVIFVPGIGGNYAKNVSAEGDLFWLLNRGVAPGLLEIDPLIRSYDGLLRTLANTGYTPGRDLFIANYDWRLMPGPSDRVYDGVITGLTAEGISDTTYQYGVDYLGDTLRVAAEVWRAAYQIPLDEVDVIAHSTGGLVTRTYIQSTAYGGVYTLTSDRLPRVKHFISVGVPHRGASKAWNPLHDNWGIDMSFRVVLSKLVNRAFQKLDQGQTISGPDGAITRAEMTDPQSGELTPVPFIRRYVPTIGALLATYAFLDRGAGELQDANSGNLANHLVLDLNNGADITPTRDPNVFLSLTKLTAIGATSEETPVYVNQRLGPARFVLAPFTDFTPANAKEGEVYFEDLLMEAGGDGTVPTLSSVGQFIGDPRARVLTYQKGINTLAKVGHTDLTDNPEIQSDILRTLGAPVKPENLVALGREDAENITSIILDPVQGFVVDGQGRRLGWSEATGPVSEIPNSFWSGGGDGFGLIFGPVAGPLRLELRGMDGPYYAQVTLGTADGQSGGVTLEGPHLARTATVSAPALLPSQPYTPQVSAGGPYTVAEGGSVQLAATGETGLSYAWDLDGDGTFETAGQSASFNAAGVDGPATRTVMVQGTLPTGQSATSAATVTVENVAPTATIRAPATATVGQPFTLALTGASDPGNDPLRFAFDCGAGYGPLGAASSASCTPTAAGTLTVRASVADDDGGVSTYSATLTVSAAPQPNKPEVPLCYANGAQSWQDFAQGKQKNGKPVAPSRSRPELALGLPQGNDTVNFVSLGFGGSITLRFANPLVNDGTSKADLRIWETSFGDGNRPWSRYPEAARVEVSLDGRTWTEIGRTTDKDQAYDLVLPRAQFVRLTDISDPRRFGGTDDGFDLDAIEALTGCARP